VIPIYERITRASDRIEVKVKPSTIVLSQDDLGAFQPTEDAFAAVDTEHLHPIDGILAFFDDHRAIVIFAHRLSQHFIEWILAKDA